MKNIARRQFLNQSTSGLIAALGSTSFIGNLVIKSQEVNAAEPTPEKVVTAEEWMNSWTKVKALEGPLYLGRFVEPMWFLLKPITWKPDSTQSGKYPTITVPIGFVTDLASIPRPFFSILRPDGEYTYPAIVHDYMYWTQSHSRDIANEIFRLGMQDIGISSATITIIMAGISVGGKSAWDSNATLKSQGEKRILKKFPDNPITRWQDWKNNSDSFES